MLFKQTRLIILFLVGLLALSSKDALMMDKPIVDDCDVQGTVIAPCIRDYYLTRGSAPQINQDLIRFAQFNRYPEATCYQYDQKLYGETFEKKTSIIATAGDSNNIILTNLPPQGSVAFVSADLARCFSEELHSEKNLPMGARLYVTEYDDCFEFSHMRWWSFKIAKEDIFTADYLESLTQDELRDLIIQQARKLLGRPYQWGGRSALPDSGFDCAGLVNVVYQSCGRIIPRGVFSQRRDSKKISTVEIKPADVIFLRRASGNRSSVIHVMLYLGDDRILHATPDPGLVEETTFQEKYGVKLSDYCEGEELNGNSFECGSFF